MIKAMLVDASFDVVGVYKAYIKADFERVRVVGALHEASIDKFWAMVESKKPDVIIMDIRFFGLGTLRLIGEIVAKYPDIKLLISGTYDDYDYLRASMEYGATDYIYKPAKKREFELALRHIVGIFEEMVRTQAEDGQILSEYERDRGFFRHRFLMNLLGGVLPDEREVLGSMEYFGMSLEMPAAAFVLRIDHFKTVIKNLDEKSKHLLIYKIFWHADKHLVENNLGYAFINSFNSITCIIGGAADLERLLELSAELKEMITKRTGLEVTIGLGRAYNDLMSLRFSANEAEAALRYRYLLGYNSIIPIDFVEPDNHITYKYPKKKEQLLVYTAVAGEYDYALKLLGEIFQALDGAGPLPDRLLPRIIMNIVISISRYASELGMDTESRFRDFFNFGEILNLRTTQEARGFMEAALRAFCDFVTERTNENAKRMVFLAKERVDENFFEDLTLEALALEFGTTADFLGKSFQKRGGMSFKDYLQSKRIAKAKEILETENAPEDEIAARVGFFDVRVFRSVFRRREGLFPLEYRK
ncbi:MAG: helix-turn-helix domain-containing protein [Clostridiales bacterium]|jgi:two-component system response regulator YesN|nr:helix-turn-helix domain-containing protein [Clostridiales bacterium]